jgi:hypothetical protein
MTTGAIITEGCVARRGGVIAAGAQAQFPLQPSSRYPHLTWCCVFGAVTYGPALAEGCSVLDGPARVR